MTEYFYDYAFRLREVRNTYSGVLGLSNTTTKYRYDKEGRQTKLVYPYQFSAGGQTYDFTVTYGYNALGQLTSLQDNRNNPASAPTTFTYEPDGLPAGMTNTNGTTATYFYDSNRRMTAAQENRPGWSQGAVSHFTYVLNARGERLQLDTARAEVGGGSNVLPKRWYYEFDRLGQLTTEFKLGTYPDKESVPEIEKARYSYDPFGNRDKVKQFGQTIELTVGLDKADRITHDGNIAMVTDHHGNVVYRGEGDPAGRNYRYDKANRMRFAQTSKAAEWLWTFTKYYYDADGNRIQKQHWSYDSSDGGEERHWAQDEQFALDVNGGLATVLTDKTWVYVWAGGRLLYQLRKSDLAVGAHNAALRVNHFDGVGSLVAQTDHLRAVTNLYDNSAFGKFETNPDPAQSFLYAGHMRDAESGLTYMRARHYDPGSGRFMQRDTFAGGIASPASLNRYSYALNNPVGNVDPSGRAPICPPGACDPKPPGSGMECPGDPRCPKPPQPPQLPTCPGPDPRCPPPGTPTVQTQPRPRPTPSVTPGPQRPAAEPAPTAGPSPRSEVVPGAPAWVGEKYESGFLEGFVAVPLPLVPILYGQASVIAVAEEPGKGLYAAGGIGLGTGAGFGLNIGPYQRPAAGPGEVQLSVCALVCINKWPSNHSFGMARMGVAVMGPSWTLGPYRGHQ